MDARVVPTGQQEECSHPATDAAQHPVCTLSFLLLLYNSCFLVFGYFACFIPKSNPVLILLFDFTLFNFQII